LWQLRKDRKARDDELLFLGRGGRPLDASTAFRDLKTAARSAGVPWASLHTLCHTCATMLFRNGLNAKQVQAWLGHHSPAFTLATYVHLLPDDLPDPEFMDAIVATDNAQPTDLASSEAEMASRRGMAILQGH
jgi:integrase